MTGVKGVYIYRSSCSSLLHWRETRVTEDAVTRIIVTLMRLVPNDVDPDATRFFAFVPHALLLSFSLSLSPVRYNSLSVNSSLSLCNGGNQFLVQSMNALSLQHYSHAISVSSLNFAIRFQLYNRSVPPAGDLRSRLLNPCILSEIEKSRETTFFSHSVSFLNNESKLIQKSLGQTENSFWSYARINTHIPIPSINVHVSLSPSSLSLRAYLSHTRVFLASLPCICWSVHRTWFFAVHNLRLRYSACSYELVLGYR